MVDRIIGSKPMPAEVLEQIVEKTDGVPLFVEELTKTVLESGLLREEVGGFAIDKALTPLAIPSTLQDSLMARLDRLAPVKEIAQIGAAIGREFPYRLLEAVSPIQGAALQDAIGQLIAAELIHRRGEPPEATYVFKHALVQDTAYGSLLRSRRQRIHADIARALEERFTDQVNAAPAILAHHYAEAGLQEPAARYWLKAAELALSRSAQTEVERHVNAGLELISRLSDGPDRQSLELSFHLVRATASTSLRGYNAQETVAALMEAKRLLDAGVGSDLQRFSVLQGLCSANQFAARIEPALNLAREIVEVANRQEDTTYRMIGYRLQGSMLFYMGQNRKALISLEQAERYRDPLRQKSLSYRFGMDPGLDVLSFKAMVLLALGLNDQAKRVREDARAELTGHNHPSTVALVTYLTVLVPEFYLGNIEACERVSVELSAYCAEHKVEHVRLMAAIRQLWARALREPTDVNIKAFRAAIHAKRQSGSLGQDRSHLLLAEILLTAGDVAAAEGELLEGFAFSEHSGERFWLAESHCLEGQIALARPEPDRTQAEACFLQAIEIARSQEARMLELRAATDLARLWCETGSPNDPRALLEPILAAIEGGETTRDVLNARTLLAEITRSRP
jgi:tetratricopeptide (TPR) repeat protein